MLVSTLARGSVAAFGCAVITVLVSYYIIYKHPKWYELLS